MPIGSGSRFTISQIMIFIVAVSLVMYGMRQDSVAALAISYLLFWVLVPFSVIVTIRRIIELIWGIYCPGCDKRGLERRAILPFGPRYFLCPNCGVRCRQGLLGAIFGVYLWQDASSPEFDVYYAKKIREDPWNAPPGLEDDDETVTSKTHANLVRNKRLRSPENPNGPGLE